MPAGQVFRLRWHYYQQFRPTDPNVLGLMLTDDDPLTNGALGRDQAEALAASQRYRGRPSQAQWPVQPRMDPNLLETPQQPDIDLRPWQQPTAPYQRWRGRVWNQWPVYSRDVTPLGSADQDVNLRPLPFQWYRPPLHAQWRQFKPVDLPQAGALPDQDVNLVFVWARMWRPPSRAPYQQPSYFDPNGLGLLLTDQDVNLVPVTGRMWRPPSRAPYQQFTPKDLLNLGLLTLDVPDLYPVLVRPQTRPSRAAFQQYTPFAPLVVDYDVNIQPVLRRVWYPPSRAPFQQFRPPFTSTLTDQDVQLRPIMPGAGAYLRYRGRQWWLVYVFYPSTTAAVAEVKYAFMSWTPVTLASISYAKLTSDEETVTPATSGTATIVVMPTGSATLSIIPLTDAEEDFS